MFIKGKVYVRREIHKLYGGQEQGGISTPADHDGDVPQQEGIGVVYDQVRAESGISSLGFISRRR